jgi:FkbM family methyltransferase
MYIMEALMDPIRRLSDKGVRYATVIDVGCADGSFFLTKMHLFPGAVPLNVDANKLYEKSLRAIKDVVGGDFRITAITDYVGEIELTESVHPYWSSIRPPGDSYWSRMNDLISTTVRVPATTLDALAKETAVKPPFLLKLDVQGAEQSALAGASSVLANTHTVICEADIFDFSDIDKVLTGAGFGLYDMTHLSRVSDGALGWFYPIYINKALDHVRARTLWNTAQNDDVIRIQVDRRAEILKWNAEKLNRIRFGQQKVARNEPCPCGSGRKFKQCCGSYSSTA